MRPELLRWIEKMRSAWNPGDVHPSMPVHRKIWEWAYITEALFERGMLAPGRRGLGFGVGRDPLAALFAGLGCEIVATDLDVEEAARDGWVESGQHASALDDLNAYGICPPDVFRRSVTFRSVDMRQIPTDLRSFDFTWSACSFEHLGSLKAGEEFLLNQMSTLRPSGVAVHTTEFNVSSDDETVEAGGTVLYRRSDIERMKIELRRRGHLIDVDYDSGHSPADLHVDRPPFSSTHLKLELDRFVATSIGLIVEKAPTEARGRRLFSRAKTRIGLSRG